MLISYVLRLRPDALAKGRFVGEIEAVTTRQRSAVRTFEQMAAFILGTTSAQVTRVAHPRQHAPGTCSPLDPCGHVGLDGHEELDGHGGPGW